MAESSTYRSRRGGTRAADDRHRRVSVVLVGHSYVWHLDHYMRESKEWMNLQLHNVEVICYGVGGARPNAGAQTEDMVSEVARHHPHIIFVHMGENDLESSTPNQIVCDLLDFVVRLARRCRSHIIVGQLINFPMNHHLTDTVDINVHLRRNMPPGHRFWRHESSLFHSQNVFLRCGVHLNDLGNSRYWRSIQTVVGRACSHTCLELIHQVPV